MTGYLLDNANHRLWIRPMIPTSMGNVITNAPLLNPRGWGTLNYNDSTVGAAPNTRYQNINVTFDSLITVNQLVLKNNLPTSVTPGNGNVRITNNGTSVTGFTVTAETNGSVYEKNLRVTLASPIQIGTGGANIQVGVWSTGVTDNRVYVLPPVLAVSESRISAGKPIHYTVAGSGQVVLDLMAINGAKIGTIFSGTVSVGSHTAIWSGRSSGGTRIGSGIAVLRLTSQTGVVNKVVCISK